MDMKEIFSKITVIFFSVILLTSTIAFSINPAYSQTLPEKGVLILEPEKDAFLKDGNGNVNEGANSILQLKGNARPVIAFNQTLIEQTIDDRPIINATLRLFIEDIGGNLGSGQQTNLHKLNQIWEEGNRAKVGGTIPGTGSGVTWKCPVDSDISDNGPDCSIQWDGGNFNATVSDSITLSNGLEGQFVDFNLTGDFQSFLNTNSIDFGWLMKKQNDEGAGTVSFTSREGIANSPELIIHYDIPDAVLANEYLTIINKLEGIGLALNSTTITQQFIDDVNVDLNRIKEIVTELQNLGFDGFGDSEIINGEAVGTVSFVDNDSGQLLFETTIPKGTLAVFISFGLIEEFEGTAGELTFSEKTSVITDAYSLTEAIITFSDVDIANNLVLAAIGAYHPSTGQTFVIIGFLIYFAIMNCLANPSCIDAVLQVITTLTGLVLDNIMPVIEVSGLKFEDINNDGIQNQTAGENGLAGFEFKIEGPKPISPLPGNPNPTFSDSNGDFGFKFRIANIDTELVITETLMAGWVPNIKDRIQFLPIANVTMGAMFGPVEFGNVPLTSTLGVVDQVSTSISPGTNGWYSGVKRIVEFDNSTFAFYYDGSNIVYKASTDNGNTWGPKQSVGTGVLDSNIGRWTIAPDNSNHVAVFYQTPTGPYTQFWVIRGTVTNSTIAFDSPDWPLRVNPQGVGMASAGTATNGNIHFAFQYEGSTTIFRTYITTNGGSTFSQTSSSINTSGSFPTAIVFTPLDSGKMLWVQGKSSNNDLFYRVYDGNSWGGQQQISNVYNCSSCAKQLSGDSDSTNSPSVAFLSDGNSGEIKVAKWDSNGGFIGVETAEDTLSHSLPSLTISDSDVTHVYSISNNIIYETVNDGSWQAPATPFGLIFDSANQLTSAIDIPAALWRENSSSPFNIIFGTP